MVSPIEWHDSDRGPVVRMLDQRRLPLDVVWTDCPDYQTVARGIRELWIRGAPAIGIAAAMGFALGAHALRSKPKDAFLDDLKKAGEALASTRPTAVNLFWALNRMKKVMGDHPDASTDRLGELLTAEALKIQREEVDRNHRIGSHGADLIRNGDIVLTHCNTGALATGGHGTALGVILSAWNQGTKLHVLVDETRPVLQGARLTMWELDREKIPCTLITDNMAAAMMKNAGVNLCIVGADRIAANGDTANKIGTYGVAVLARAHEIPFYVAAPTSTIDFSLDSGDKIPIEERDPLEVSTVMGRIRIAPEGVRVANPAFDVTPAGLITGIITENGIFRPEDLRKEPAAS
jgi:methylthioribose-1-phosphate isomerase